MLDFVKYVFFSCQLSMILDLILILRLTKAHTGEYLALKLAECLQGYKIDDKVHSNFV